jgi:hypothetical protein
VYDIGSRRRTVKSLRWLDRSTYRAAAIIGLCAGAFATGQVGAGGIIAYEVGTADVGLASAGYGARAQDASTILTNPAGMTRLEGNQFLAAGQLDYGRTEFSVGSGTSPLLGSRRRPCSGCRSCPRSPTR